MPVNAATLSALARIHGVRAAGEGRARFAVEVQTMMRFTKLSMIAVLSAVGAATAGVAAAQQAAPEPQSAPQASAPQSMAQAADPDQAAPAAGDATSVPDQVQTPDTGATASTRVMTNGPVPDTRANRARYGGPMSHAGKRSAPSGN
jgi:hypothetical protein